MLEIEREMGGGARQLGFVTRRLNTIAPFASAPCA